MKWESVYSALSELNHPPFPLEAGELQVLFDSVPDVLFFVKDLAGRYLYANATMVRRLGLKSRTQLIGKRVDELYPIGLSASYAKQDRDVLEGAIIHDLLELHLYPNSTPGWCLTCKRPIYMDNKVQGLMGISRDLDRVEARGDHYEKLRATLTYLNEHFSETIYVTDLAKQIGFSVSKLERSFRSVFQLTPLQLVAQLRIQAAMHELRGNKSVADIGQSCGFSDQSAFARRFRELVGMSPSEYRAKFSAEATDSTATASTASTRQDQNRRSE
ncbi:AraC family transcriptional regulator [Dyella flagellata]|uniref:AraC family transcriptional regulator n=1 Tax=Dyella flagellata TaxID=1867833 RepID=A0ABQ5XF12_9GAMM|nr:AraC family transcriptional regulator [Dyella flagellata]GLQ89769.1 AraC family transcriptional regulator [Dyella flagellata]